MSAYATDNVISILRLGVIGLGFLLAVLAYLRLAQEQKRNPPRQSVLDTIKWFMGFSVALCLIGSCRPNFAAR